MVGLSILLHRETRWKETDLRAGAVIAIIGGVPTNYVGCKPLERLVDCTADHNHSYIRVSFAIVPTLTFLRMNRGLFNDITDRQTELGTQLIDVWKRRPPPDL